MAKAKVTIQLEIEYDELQYEQDGRIKLEDVKEAYFEYTILNSEVSVSLVS